MLKSTIFATTVIIFTIILIWYYPSCLLFLLAIPLLYESLNDPTVQYTGSGELTFKGFPEFRPNLTPRQIFKRGSFGGTYWRPIHSAITGKNYRNKHLKYDFLKDLDSNLMTRPWDEYDININKYGVHVGQTLEEWEKQGWITKYDPYGWVQWYCNFYSGRRCDDDERQIKRWLGVAGINGRFRHRKSPKILQTLQHWAWKVE